MKINRIATLAFFIILLLVLPSAHAVNLSFSTPNTNLTAGNSFIANLWISGLGDHASPALSTFDITIGFDPFKLSFDTSDVDGDGNFGSVIFGSGLDIMGIGSNPRATIAFPDSLRIWELSLDTASDLVANQSDSFILASITFIATDIGNTALSIINNPLILGDENGYRLDPDPGALDLTINPVPESATIILLCTGLLGLGAGIKRRRK